MPTVPQLMLTAFGRAGEAGDFRCFYCAAPCGKTNAASEYVQDSFTGRNDVAAPGSPYVCDGCVLCLREACVLDLIDGVQGRFVPKGAMRAFSWVVSASGALAASKAHAKQLRKVCLEPPEPPFAIVLSDSGKKHLLYRGTTCHDRSYVSVTLEGRRIDYAPDSLRSRLSSCGKLIAATGKPALQELPTVRFAVAVCDYFPDRGEELLREWEDVRDDPITALAVWLSDGREQQRLLYPTTAGPPGRGVVPPKAGGTDGPKPPARRVRGRGGDQGGGHPLLFDLGPPLR